MLLIYWLMTAFCMPENRHKLVRKRNERDTFSFKLVYPKSSNMQDSSYHTPTNQEDNYWGKGTFLVRVQPPASPLWWVHAQLCPALWKRGTKDRGCCGNAVGVILIVQLLVPASLPCANTTALLMPLRFSSSACCCDIPMTGESTRATGRDYCCPLGWHCGRNGAARAQEPQNVLPYGQRLGQETAEVVSTQCFGLRGTECRAQADTERPLLPICGHMEHPT